MQLVGHGGDVLGMAFSPDGSSVASCSFDRTILLWRTYDECENYMMLRGHKNAVTQVRTHSSRRSSWAVPRSVGVLADLTSPDTLRAPPVPCCRSNGSQTASSS
jgi:Prp8 binding protein